MAGRNKAFFNKQNSKRRGRRVGRGRGYRMPYSCAFSEPGLWIEGGGIFVGKLATGTIFSPPWKFVKDEPSRSFDYSLRFFCLFLCILSFKDMYIYIYIYEFCELKISGFRNIPDLYQNV